jgi:hypothetical protein
MWEDNIKQYLKQTLSKDVDWIRLVQYMDQWWQSTLRLKNWDIS